jgi:hypothetical protein
VSAYLLILGALACPALLAIWLAKAHRSRRRHWGDQPSKNSIMVGAEIDMPRILPVEPVAGPALNGAPVDDLSNTLVIETSRSVR